MKTRAELIDPFLKAADWGVVEVTLGGSPTLSFSSSITCVISDFRL